MAQVERNGVEEGKDAGTVMEWQGSKIASFEDTRTHVENLETEDDKFELCATFLELLRKQHNTRADLVEQLFEYTEQSGY
jgi:hypothetical protein